MFSIVFRTDHSNRYTDTDFHTDIAIGIGIGIGIGRKSAVRGGPLGGRRRPEFFGLSLSKMHSIRFFLRKVQEFSMSNLLYL